MGGLSFEEEPRGPDIMLKCDVQLKTWLQQLLSQVLAVVTSCYRGRHTLSETMPSREKLPHDRILVEVTRRGRRDN